MAYCAVCTATRSALLSSSCRALNSRTISSTSSSSSATSTTPSRSSFVTSTATKVRGQRTQQQKSTQCRALSTNMVGIHHLPIRLASSLLLTSTTVAGSYAGHNNSLLLASTAAAVLAACSINFVASTKVSSPIRTTSSSAAPVSGTISSAGDGSGNGGGNGGEPSTDTVAPVAASLRKKSQDDVRRYEESITKNPNQVSNSAEQGVRWTMEDTFTVANGGHFAAVFDGHGGSGVSGMLRDHIHRLYSKALFQRHSEENQRSVIDQMQVDDDNHDDTFKNNSEAQNHGSSFPSIRSHIAAIRVALERIERESLRHDHFEYQGSTAVVVIVHVGENGERTLVSANIGDSRAILCRGRQAINLTRDHKPSDEKEKARIRSMGEDVQWDPYGEIYRVKDLSLSRAIGDKFAKPVVSSEAEIDCVPVNDVEDQFFLLASDGLWDVMTSQEVVDFVHEMLECPTQTVKTKKGKIALTKEFRKRKMARFIAHEALERGSADNVCVILVWLQKEKE